MMQHTHNDLPTRYQVSFYLGQIKPILKRCKVMTRIINHINSVVQIFLILVLGRFNLLLSYWTNVGQNIQSKIQKSSKPEKDQKIMASPIYIFLKSSSHHAITYKDLPTRYQISFYLGRTKPVIKHCKGITRITRTILIASLKYFCY